MEKYIIGQTGTFADGKSTPCLQVLYYDKEKKYYRLVNDFPNDPNIIERVRTRKAAMEKGPDSKEWKEVMDYQKEMRGGG